MAIAIFSFVCLIFCWFSSDVSFRAKMIFTVLYGASWGLLFIPRYGFLFTVAQCMLIGVIGAATFGLDWLMRRPR